VSVEDSRCFVLYIVCTMSMYIHLGIGTVSAGHQFRSGRVRSSMVGSPGHRPLGQVASPVSLSDAR